MNTPWDEQDERLRQLDLLVDGELNEAQRRELLLSLEREPEGWRRCALAFLEAQSWGATIGRMTTDVAKSVEPPVERSVAPVSPSNWGLRQVTTWLAMAASVVVCFCLGLSADRWWGQAPPTGERQFQVAGGQRPFTPGNQPPGGMSYVATGAQPGDHDSWLLDSPAVPRQVVDVLERMGSRVKQERQFLPVPLNDGRRVIVPVDQIELTPANLRDFQ